jgi:hypothetical protein
MVTTILMVNKIRSETLYLKFETCESIKQSGQEKEIRKMKH